MNFHDCIENFETAMNMIDPEDETIDFELLKIRCTLAREIMAANISELEEIRAEIESLCLQLNKSRVLKNEEGVG
jgi:hypothetical protein